MAVKLADWARSQGISYRTAWRWWRVGKLPARAKQTATGTILVDEPREVPGSAVLYARVASKEHTADLARQVAIMMRFVGTTRLVVTGSVEEIGGMKRPKLIALLADPRVGTVVVEHRDRLARVGSDLIEAALRAQGRRLVVADPGEQVEDLEQDLIDTVAAMYSRSLGRAAARRKAARIVGYERARSEIAV